MNPDKKYNLEYYMKCVDRIVNMGASAEVLKKCLQAEEVSVDVQGVRERVMRIGRMNHILKDGDEVGAEIAVRWLLGMYLD